MKAAIDYRNDAEKLFKSADQYFCGTKRNRALNGDIYEKFFRNTLREILPGLRVGRGVVVEGDNNFSREMDVIVYSGRPRFDYDDVVAVGADSVLAVVQVKGYICNPKKDILGIAENLDSAARFNSDIQKYCFTVVANAKRTYSDMRSKFAAQNIGFFSLWEGPGKSAGVTGAGGFCDFIESVMKECGR